MVKVFDISKWNAINNYSNLIKESGGVIVRVGYRGNSTGVIATDTKFASHIDNLKKGGANIGVYFFTTAITEQEAKEEALWTIKQVKAYNIDLKFPIMIDTEYCNTTHTGRSDKIDKNLRTKVVKAFIETCRSNGYEAAIYASDSWFYDMLKESELKGYKKWVAKYSTSEPKMKDSVIGWQYSSSATSIGVVGKLDISNWYTDINSAAAKYSKAPDKVEKAPAKKEESKPAASTPKKVVIEDGSVLNLKDAELFSSSTTSKVVKTISGKYYVWNSLKRSGRIRITNKKENVGVNGQVTGWISVDSIK